jgi:hypothetical protein
MAETTDQNGQVFDVLEPDQRPHDEYGDGRSLRFTTHEHDELMMPQAIEVTDPDGRWAVYVPLVIGGKIVRPRPERDPESAVKK